MIGDKVKYTCKNCGWTTSIREEWSDLKPRRCMNKKCNTSFLKNPDSLIIQLPDKTEDKPTRNTSRRSKKNESADDQPQ